MTPAPDRIDRLVATLPWIFGVLFGAVALHLVLVLVLPKLAPTSAYRREVGASAPGALVRLPRAAPDVAGPGFADPFAALAFCRFDLAQGPLRLRAEADGDHPLSVSARSAAGVILYSGDDRQTPKGRFNVLILTQAQADAIDEAREEAESGDKAPAQPDDELRVITETREGFVLVRALGRRESEYDAASAAKIDCALEKSAP